MTKKTFRSMVILVLCMLAVCVGLIMGVLYNYFDKQFYRELQNEASYISEGVELNGMDYLENISSGSSRITWIDKDGTVLFDNKVDASSLENHGEREEVRQAEKYGAGSSTRYSNTRNEKTINYALRLDDDTVLRVSADSDTMLRILTGMIQPIIAVIAIALIVAGILAYRLSKRIVRPLNDIDLEHPEQANTYEELSPFLRKIEVQNKQINRQIKELRRQQMEFSAITENMKEGFLIIDVKQNILSYNSSALKLLDVNGNVENENILHLNRSEDFQNAIIKSLKGEHTEQSMKFGERYYQLLANPVYQDNKVSGAIIVIMDVTEKEQREALRREFTANVSHELKTPLTSISGTAEIMANGLVKQEDIPHFANNIYKESQRLITLVGDIIKLSKLEEMDMTEQKEMVDLAEVVTSVTESLQIPASKKSISLIVQMEPCMVWGIPSILNEIVYNLCDNAVKYNVEKGTVYVKLEKKDKRVCLTVEDTGIGIPREEQERIFERFYRVDKSHSKDIGGTGLGLSIVKHGVAYHNAELKLESEVGKGTKITILF
ncbi:MAG TPA: PAS domain S-box protein [Candidatus Eubacterium avistercoris]|uniref:histidine kinase n=1 Tax=Candidatus Eubacterium avistercoris TaxID=2838567 RepID=A0A9D2IGU8_9FIRM|nr:PAS domain S-box protein [Candidatus Eubacterium avistercoris]